MALEKLILNKDLRETMGNNSRKKVIQEFSQERIAKETFEVWESLFAMAALR
jgi:glycosyltransferase involved in cell wall biosynthesis